jgi:hypothetical protein
VAGERVGGGTGRTVGCGVRATGAPGVTVAGIVGATVAGATDSGGIADGGDDGTATGETAGVGPPDTDAGDAPAPAEQPVSRSAGTSSHPGMVRRKGGTRFMVGRLAVRVWIDHVRTPTIAHRFPVVQERAHRVAGAA